MVDTICWIEHGHRRAASPPPPTLRAQQPHLVTFSDATAPIYVRATSTPAASENAPLRALFGMPPIHFEKDNPLCPK